MSKTKSSIILDMSKDISSWNNAIFDAEKKIIDSRNKISALRKSIKIFTQLRDSGAPFPNLSDEAKK